MPVASGSNGRTTVSGARTAVCGAHRARGADPRAGAGGCALVGRGGGEMLQVHAVFDQPDARRGQVKPIVQLPGDKGGVGDEDHVALARHPQFGLPVHSVHGVKVHADPAPPGTAFFQSVDPCPVHAVARSVEDGGPQPFVGCDQGKGGC